MLAVKVCLQQKLTLTLNLTLALTLTLTLTKARLQQKLGNDARCDELQRRVLAGEPSPSPSPS